MAKQSIQIEYTDVDSIDQLSDILRKAAKSAIDASKNAYAPYSNFPVGAAVVLEDGSIVIGSNQENRAFPSGLCAERVAITSASANHPNQRMQAIVVYAPEETIISPCGACRQVIFEYEEKQSQPIQVILVNGKGEARLFEASSDLLPWGFKFKKFKR